MKKLLTLLVLAGFLGVTTGCPAPTTKKETKGDVKPSPTKMDTPPPDTKKEEPKDTKKEEPPKEDKKEEKKDK